MPKVSIIIPVYNVEKYLRQCLDSVVNQTLKDIEIICVNDCSPDNSLAILQEYANKDNRIKIIDLKENGGLGNARNVALPMVTSNYVMFLDSDDWLELNACEFAYKQIAENNNDFSIFSLYEFFEKNNIKKQNNEKIKPFLDISNKKQFNADDINSFFLGNCECWYKIYNTEFLIKNKIYFTRGAYEDQTFNCMIYNLANSISVLNIPLYNYRIRSGSITTQVSTFDDYINAKLKAFDYIIKLQDSVRKSKLLKYWIIAIINYTWFYFNKFIHKNKNYENGFYKKIRELFIFINDKYSIKELNKEIDYKNFILIIENKNYLIYKLKKIFFISLLSMRTTENHQILHVFGIRFKLSLKKIKIPYFIKNYFSIKNENNYKIVTILGLKVKIRRKFKKIVFTNFRGKGYGDSPKYIAEKIIEQNLPFDLVWLLDKHLAPKDIPSSIKVKRYSKRNTIKYLSNADIWISNCRMTSLIPFGLKKKDGQLYIQTWHGSLGFKKIENDIKNNDCYTEYLKTAEIDSKMIDYLLSPSKFDTECLKKCFYYDGTILEFGYPRNDLFFYSDDKKNNIIKKVRKYYKIPTDTKIVLYVPTFRDSKELDVYKINSNDLIKKLSDKYGSKWVLLTRLHPNLIEKKDELSQLLKDSINVTYYPDLQELLLASDILITDYSSVIWDFCLQDKPAFVFATDIEAYTKERDFYIPLCEMPFSISQTQEELFKNIINCNTNEYTTKIKEYIKRYKGHFDDGNASERVVEIIKEFINADIKKGKER